MTREEQAEVQVEEPCLERNEGSSYNFDPKAIL